MRTVTAAPNREAFTVAVDPILSAGETLPIRVVSDRFDGSYVYVATDVTELPSCVCCVFLRWFGPKLVPRRSNVRPARRPRSLSFLSFFAVFARFHLRFTHPHTFGPT